MLLRPHFNREWQGLHSQHPASVNYGSLSCYSTFFSVSRAHCRFYVDSPPISCYCKNNGTSISREGLQSFQYANRPWKEPGREMAKIIRLLSCLIIIIMIIIIIIYRYFYRYPIALYNDWNQHKVLKKLIPIGRRQTSWLFTQHSWWVELEVTENKSNTWQGGGHEPGTTRLQVQHPNHSATPPPWWRKWNRKVVMRDTRLVHVNIVCWYIFVTSWQSLVLRRMWHEREKTFNTMTGTNLWQSDV